MRPPMFLEWYSKLVSDETTDDRDIEAALSVNKWKQLATVVQVRTHIQLSILKQLFYEKTGKNGYMCTNLITVQNFSVR